MTAIPSPSPCHSPGQRPPLWSRKPRCLRSGPNSTASPSTASVSAGLTQVLYLQESGNATAISASDINQGQMGDCYLLSSIGEIALFHPSLITSMIQANADGTETVTLYDAANGSLPTFGTTSFKPVAVNVTNTFPSNAVNNGATQDVLNGQKEIWVQVLEKAVATLCGGYGAIGNGGIPVFAMEELTGCAATYSVPGSLSLQQLQTASATGDLITFDTQGSGTLAYGLYGDHAYMFDSLTTVGGTVMVNLLNPWGFDQPQPIPFSQIGSAFDEIDIGQFSRQSLIETGPTLAQQTAGQTWTQGSHVTLTLAASTFTDPLGQKLTYMATQANGQPLPVVADLQPVDLTFSGSVPSGMQSLSLRVTATDTSGLSCSETFQATGTRRRSEVGAPDCRHRPGPKAHSFSFTLATNTFADPNSETLTYAASLSNGQALPSWLTLNGATDTFSGSVATTLGPLSIKLTATDTSGLSASETFQATIVAPAPTLTDQTANQIWTADSGLSFTLASNTFTVAPGQTLKYTATLPAGLTINASTGTISGIVPVTLGTDTIKLTATQTGGLSAAETFTATIVASAPTLTNQIQGQTWTANRPVSLTLPANSFTDPQGEKLTYTMTGLPAGLSFNTATQAITGTTVAAASSYKITVTVKDQSGLSATETFQATINALAPATSQTPDQSWTANKAVSLSVAPAFIDPQGEKLTYTAILSNGKALPTGLTFNATTATFGGVAPTTLGTLGITVTAKDQSGLSASETFHSIVTAAAPVASGQTPAATWTVGKAVSFTPGTNAFVDPQGEKLTYAATMANGSTLPTWLKFNAATDAFSGTAPITPETLGLTVTATDTSGLSAAQTVSATIQPASPTVAHQTANQPWTDGASMSFLLPSNTFSDPQGTALSYAAYETSGSDQTSWLRFEPGSADFIGTVPTALAGTIGIKVVATDLYGLSTSETFGLTFGASGTHPIATAAPSATELLAFHA